MILRVMEDHFATFCSRYYDLFPKRFSRCQNGTQDVKDHEQKNERVSLSVGEYLILDVLLLQLGSSQSFFGRRVQPLNNFFRDALFDMFANRFPPVIILRH